jgi:exodeoxyribonuclease-3
MLIASWNVNSLKSRLPHVLDWVEAHRPDALMLQELKSLDFPNEPFERLGYHCAWVGQKAYNGVAIVGRKPFDVDATSLPGDATDTQARYLETTINGVKIVNIYLPNGNPVCTVKFDYKLAWMDRLKKRMSALKRNERPVVIGGDFNVIPEDIDCFSPKYWKNDALFQPEPRERFRGFLKLGYSDAFRHFHDGPGHYTFWEYFRDQFSKNQEIRIDHFLVSSAAAKRMVMCVIDKQPRGLPKPSDHAPILLTLK